MDTTLNEPSQIQKKLQKAITNKAPDCLKTKFDSATTAADGNRNGFITTIDDIKKKTYSVGNANQQNLPDAQHDLGSISFPKPGKKSFRLVKTNADNTFFKTQFDSKPFYKDWSEYKPIIEQLYPIYSKHAAIISQLSVDIEALEKDGKCCGEPEKALLESLNESRCLHLDSIQDTQIQLCKIAYKVIDKNKDWMSYWLWYTEGKPLLNPFGVVSPTEANEKIDRELASAEAVLQLYNALSDKCCESSSVKDMLATLKPAISELTHDLVQLRQLKENTPARQKKYEEWLKSTVQTETVLNEVVLYASDCPQINWMTHYDAQGNYIAMQSDGLLPDLVFEKDALRGLVHDIPLGRQVSAKEVVKEAKLRTEIDVQTDDFVSTFTQALISSNTITSLLDRIRGTLNTIRAVSTKTTESALFGLSSVTASGKSKQKSTQEQARQDLIIDELRDLMFISPKHIIRDTVKSQGKIKLLKKGKIRLLEKGKIRLLEKDKIELFQGKIKLLNDPKHKLNILDTIQANFDLYKDVLNTALKRDDNNAKPVSEREFYEAVEVLKEEVRQETNANEAQKNVSSTCINRFTIFETSSQLIDWLMAQTEPPIVDLEAAYSDFKKKKATQEALLRSEDVLINESRNAKGTNDISYDIFEAGKEKPVASGSYKTYNTVRFWPSVSINYVFGSRAVSIFDNATGQFRTDTDVDNFEAVVGVKWYLGPSNVTRTSKRTGFIRNTFASKYNQLRGNSLLGKVFVTGGLGVTHKFLRNYFLGLGVDIVPGFSIQGGGNLFFRKAYDLNNGQISHEYDIPAGRLFFGLAIDPSVVTKLFSIF